MIDMDRQKAFAVLGLPDDASREEIDALVSERRRKLRQRIVFAATAEQRESSERALSELETAHTVAVLAPTDPESAQPAGVHLNLANGKTLDDRYVIRRRIGYGENGAVFAALDLSWGKEVALKVFRPELLLVPGTSDRLKACVQNVFELAHSGIVGVYGLVEADGYTFVPMELLPDRTLRTVVQEAPPVPPGQRRSGMSMSHIVEILEGICTALDYASSRTLHLNLKPDNVIITDDGFVKLTDFGFDPILGPALQVTSPTAREQRRYRAPELARQSETGSSGSTPIDGRADQFSVAAIAHYLLLAAAPYPDPSPTALRHRGLTKPLAEVLSRALSSEPRERFASVAEFSAAFKRAANERVSRRLMMTSAAIMLIVGFASTVAVMVASRGDSSSAWFSPVLNLIPGLKQGPPANAAIIRQQERVLALSRSLIDQQNTLRREAIEGRITARSKAQALDLSETDAQYAEAEAAYVVAERDYQKVVALREIANPDIFNSPDTLNAINLIGLASEHISEGRDDAAALTLQHAERVLTEKLRDYKQAQDLVDQRFAPEEPQAVSDTVETAPVFAMGEGRSQTVPAADDLRRDWIQASQSRRRFAAEVQAKMVTIAGGAFEMGDVTGTGNQTEQPVRTVLVPTFQLSAFEVTRAEYGLCVADNACAALGSGPGQSDGSGTMPASGLSWFDAQSYLTWVSQKTGEDYRLPTEAEWEYAARGGLTVAYPWGNDVGRGRANCINCGSAWEGLGPSPVGSFAPNGFGLYDLSGNVWEWTADCWYGDYTGAPAIAIAREGNALCAERTLRGGSWDNDAFLARTTYRGRGRADMRQDIYGLRIAKSVD